MKVNYLGRFLCVNLLLMGVLFVLSTGVSSATTTSQGAISLESQLAVPQPIQTQMVDQYQLVVKLEGVDSIGYVDCLENDMVKIPLGFLGYKNKNLKRIEGQLYKSEDGYLQLHDAQIINENDQLFLWTSISAKRLMTVVYSKNSEVKTSTLLMNREGEWVLNISQPPVKKLKVLSNELILVNKDNALMAQYPSLLTKLSPTGILTSYSGMLADEKIISPLQKMFSAGKAQKYNFIVSSAYRNKAKQQSILNSTIAEFKSKFKNFLEMAYLAVLAPGYSEHETGLAVDIFTTSNPTFNSFTGSSAAKWLKDNAHKYGFILRYPEGKTAITKIKYEAWHYRYVGVGVATYMTENQLTYEEFVEKLSKGVLIKEGGVSYLYISHLKNGTEASLNTDLETSGYWLTQTARCIKIKLLK